MSNKFVSFLQAVGRDFEKGLAFILPVAEAAVPVIAVGNPALAGVLQSSIGVVISVEQKFAAMGKQTGSGTQKLGESVSILYPAFEQIFAQYGVQIDKGNVEQYINAIVAALNAFPALPAPAQPTQTPAPAAKPVIATGTAVLAVSPQTNSTPAPEPIITSPTAG